MLQYLLLLFMGLAGGFLAGLIGIGGGVMYILVLPYLLVQMGFPESEIVQFTIANSLFATMFAALSGSISLIRYRDFYWREVALVGFFGTLASLSVLAFVVNTPWYQRDQFNIIIILMMCYIIYRTLRQVKQDSEIYNEQVGKPQWLALTGIGAGTASALSGLGGGVVIIPILNVLFRLSMKRAKSISLGVIFIMSMSLSIFNVFTTPASGYQNQSTGFIVWPLALLLALGVVIGSPFGVATARKLSNRWIGYIFVLFSAVVIIDKLLQLF